MGIVIKANEISKTYNLGDSEVHALKNVDVALEEDTFYAVIGKSGSGKSTLLHVLCGLIRPDKGTVFVGNKNIYSLKDKKLSEVRRKDIGIVFQNYNLLPEFTVKDNILMPIYLDGSNGDEDYIKEMVRTLGLKKLLDKYPAQLSGGEQQRVAIARALVMRPQILFADEPTGNLDKNSGKEVMKLLRFTKERFHQTIFLVTHDLDIAKKADVIILIEDGEIKKVRGRYEHN